MYPYKLNSLTIDSAERQAYLGCSNGYIYQTPLNDNFAQAADSAEFLKQDYVQQAPASSHLMAHHTAAISCIDVSVDGSRLVSAADDGKLHVWDTSTRQVLHTLKSLNGEISFVHV